MKKLLLLPTFAAALSFTACSDDKPTVVHETRVVHHYHSSGENVNAPSSNSPDNFQAVERPATYSH